MAEPALPFETFMGQHGPLGDLIGEIDESIRERSAASPGVGRAANWQRNRPEWASCAASSRQEPTDNKRRPLSR